MKSDHRLPCAFAVCLLLTACAGESAPEELGWFVVDAGETRALAGSEPSGRRDAQGQTIFGVTKLHGPNVSDRDAYFVVVTTDVPAIRDNIVLARLETKPGRRLQGVFYTPANSVPLEIVPSEKDDRKLELVPGQPLTPGPYGFFVGERVEGTEPAIYDFVVLEDLDAKTLEERIETIRAGRLDALTFNAERHGATAIPYLLELTLLFHSLGPEGPVIESSDDQTPSLIIEALAGIGRADPDAFATVLREKYACRLRNLEEPCLIAHVIVGSPAERAGLLAGDVVIGIDGQRIESVNDLNEFLDATLTSAPAQELAVRVRRGDAESDLRLIEGRDGSFGFSVGAPDHWVPDREALTIVSAAAVATAGSSGDPILSAVRELHAGAPGSQRRWFEWLFPGLVHGG